LVLGWKLPGAEHQSSDLHDWATQLQERDIEGSRVENPKRKASQDKWTGLNAFPGDPYPDDLLDMENTVWPHFPTNPWNMPDWDFADYPDPEETHVGSWWGSDPGSGGAWRVCRPEAGGYYIECGTCENWPINQPDSDILELTTFTGQGNWTHFDNSLITVCAYAGAEDGQEITVGYTGIPVVGGKMYPPYHCEKTYYVQCEDCECQGAVPPINGDSATIDPDGGADNTVDLWVDSSLACGPFSWEVSGWGFHFGSTSGPTTGETEEELEIITLYADSSACGTATITVTDSCGVTGTAYLKCTSGKWKACNSSSVGGCTTDGTGWHLYLYSPVCAVYSTTAAPGDGYCGCPRFTGGESYCVRCREHDGTLCFCVDLLPYCSYKMLSWICS